MKKTLLILTVVLSAFIGAVLGVLFMIRYVDLTPSYSSIEAHQSTRLVNLRKDSSYAKVQAGLNFEAAAQLVTPAVVHIRAIYGPGNFSLNPLDHSANPNLQSTGSGVLISDDGFIVTNNHVIEEANTVEVVMNNNQRFYAKVIGADPSTDLALLKIKAKGLPFVKYGDSDRIKTGEWVLAIGNPFDLNSTVTAGIVSAKARNIGILRVKNNLQIESFIQTDAAVNPGSSGGALVNLKGELLGINSAIATATGGYAGYSFAIPVSLVKKIMDDLLEFGQVQRGILGIGILDVTADLAERRHLDVVRGVLVDNINSGSAAEKSGIEKGDVITAVNDNSVENISELQEWVARKRPGEVVYVTYRRDGKEFRVKSILKTFEGSEQFKKKEVAYELEGAILQELTYKELTQFNLDGGVMVKKVMAGKWKKSGLREEFIITYIDKVPIDNVADLNRSLELKRGGVLVEGLYKNGEKATYGIDW